MESEDGIETNGRTDMEKKKADAKKRVGDAVRIYQPRDRRDDAHADVLGSYTGSSVWEDGDPDQDADDL